MGIIVLAVAILPLLGVGGMQLYRAGDARARSRTPSSRRASPRPRKLLWAGLCRADRRLHRWRCAAAGMNWFDAICHGFSALSLGGFSTHDASIGLFQFAADRIGADRCSC